MQRNSVVLFLYPKGGIFKVKENNRSPTGRGKHHKNGVFFRPETTNKRRKIMKFKKKRPYSFVVMIMTAVMVASGVFESSGTAFADTVTRNNKGGRIDDGQTNDAIDTWNRNGGVYSSYDDAKNKAMKVNADYSYAINETEDTEYVVEKGTKVKDGTEVVIYDYNGTKDTYSATAKKPVFLATKNSAGNIRIRKTNCTIYSEEKHSFIKMDVVNTITDFKQADADHSGNKEGYFQFTKGLNGIHYAGNIKQLAMQTSFYKPGTTTAISIKTNLTLKDIDTGQWIGISANKVNGQYVASDTHLTYNNNDGWQHYYGPKEGTASIAQTAVGFTFEGSTFSYSFGKDVSLLDIGYTEPTGYSQYVSASQNNMGIPEQGKPKKTVSVDGDAAQQDTISVRVRDLAETWTYKIAQPIANGLPSKWRYDNFEFHDQIDECLKILKVKVNGTDGVFTKDVSSWFNITKNNNNVTATLKDPKGNGSFYEDYTVYQLEVQVRVNVPQNWTAEQKKALEDKWEQHGHFASANSSLLFSNVAKTIVDGKEQQTDLVSTTIELPGRADSWTGFDVTKTVDKYEHKVGDTIVYTATVKNNNANADSAYFQISDVTIPDCIKLDFSSIKVTGIDPANYTLSQSGNGWILRSKGDYVLPYNSTIKISFNATAGEKSNGVEMINRVRATALGVPEKEADAKIWINSPDLKVNKKADKQKYKVGDIVTYTADISMDSIGCVARNIVIKDAIATESVKLQKNSIVLMDAGGNIIKDAEVTVKDNDFEIATKRNLINTKDKYYLYDVGQNIGKTQDKFNPLGIEKEAAFKIEYQMAITDEDLAGQDIKNIITATSDEKLPKEDEETVIVQGPNLDIEKSSNAGVYQVGETGKYKIVARQTRDGETAKNAVIKDAFGIEGVVIDKESIKLYINGEEVTPESIEVSETGFTMKTGKDLTDADKVEVTYNALFQDAALDGKAVPNTASISADNAAEKKANHEVQIKNGAGPVLKIVKKTDKDLYYIGESAKYTLTVSQERLDATAENIVITDLLNEKGAQLDPDTIKVTVAGQDITKDCKLTVKENGQYELQTNTDLSTQVMTITYDVWFKDASLRDQEVKNTATAKANNADEVETDHTVKIGKKDSEIAVKKDAKDKEYKVGDLIPYKIQVALTKKGDTAKNVVIKDTIPEELEIQKDSIKVTGVKDYEIKIQDNILTVNVNQMAYGETAIVQYHAKILMSAEGKDIKNKVEVTGEDVIPNNASKSIHISKPGEKPKDTPKKTSSKIAKTMDTAKPWLFAGILIVAAGTGVVIWRRKKNS